MNWKRHLVELALAGGTLGMSSCGVPRCNANPDPCCFDANGSDCAAAKQSCANVGLVHARGASNECTSPDGGDVILNPDGGLPREPDADGGTTGSGSSSGSTGASGSAGGTNA